MASSGKSLVCVGIWNWLTAELLNLGCGTDTESGGDHSTLYTIFPAWQKNLTSLLTTLKTRQRTKQLELQLDRFHEVQILEPNL